MAGVLFLFLASAGFAGPNVLLIWDDDAGTAVPGDLDANTQSLLTAMRNAGLEVTLSATTQGRYTGFNPQPSGFDAVVHLNGGGPNSYIMGSAGVNRLVEYVNNEGGAYIGAENNSAQMAIPIQFGGLSSAMTDLTVIDRVRGWGVDAITLTVVSGQESHPLLTGIPASFTFTAGRKEGQVRSYAAEPGTALMTDGAGSDAVAVRSFGAGRVVSFHHTGNTAEAPTLSNPNIQKLYINGVLWGDTRVPATVSLTRAGEEVTGPGSLAFTARFSEGVTGVNAGDFVVAATGAISFSSPLVISAVSDREYSITVNGVTGSGVLGVDLVDNDSIRDKSLNQNRLGGEGTGNGDLTGETYTVDGKRPSVSQFVSDQTLWALNSTPHFTILFDEDMDTTQPPDVVIETDHNGSVTASSAENGGDGMWVTARQYAVSMDRAVASNDAGLASVTISGASDLVGNVMIEDTGSTLALIRGALYIISEPLGYAMASLGSSHTFELAIAGATGTPQYQWYKEAASKAFQPVGPNSPRYTLTDLDYGDSGVYYCVVNDSISSAQSTPSTLEVVESIPVAGAYVLTTLSGILALLGAARLRRRA